MEQELDEYCGICFDCSKYDDCTKRSDDMAECPDFEEARFCLTPKGVFNSVLNDLGWCKFLDKKADISWELYEHRAPEHALDKEAFTKVLVDIGFVGEGDNIIDVAFDAFVERMRRHGYLEDNNNEEKGENQPMLTKQQIDLISYVLKYFANTSGFFFDENGIPQLHKKVKLPNSVIKTSPGEIIELRSLLKQMKKQAN